MWWLSSFPSSLPNFFPATNSKTVRLSTRKLHLNAELTFSSNIEWIELLHRMCQRLRCDFCRSRLRERCKFHSLPGSVAKLSARQTLTFQPLPSSTSVESAKIWKTRDQPKPGSLFGKMRDPVNEVAFKPLPSAATIVSPTWRRDNTSVFIMQPLLASIKAIDISFGNSVLNVTAMYNLLKGLFLCLPFIKNLWM